MIGKQIAEVFNTILLIYPKQECAKKRKELDETLRMRVYTELKLIQNLLEVNQSEYLVGHQIQHHKTQNIFKSLNI